MLHLLGVRKKVYLFAPKDNPSIFIKELLKINKQIKIRKDNKN